MSGGMRETLESLIEFLERKKQSRALDSDVVEMLDKALDRVIEGTDRNISLVPGYRRKLQNSILGALEYADRIVENIPGPIEVASGRFVADPYVRAFFRTVSGLKTVYNKSSELKEYFEENRNDVSAGEGTVLLCMQKVEENILGMKEQNGHVIKDVPQTRISFTGHRMQSPAKSESEARKALKCCIFEGLVDNALAEISRHREDRRKLEIELNILRNRLNKNGKINGSLPDYGNTEDRYNSLKYQLDKIGFATPEHSLEKTKEILEHPDDYVRLRKKAALRPNFRLIPRTQ